MSENASVTANLGPQHLSAARDTVAQVLEEAKRQGASAAEAQLSLAQGLSVDVRLGEVETVEFHRDRGVAVTVFFGQRKGQASTSDDSPQSLRDAVAAACAIARYRVHPVYFPAPAEAGKHVRRRALRAALVVPGVGYGRGCPGGGAVAGPASRQP